MTTPKGRANSIGRGGFTTLSALGQTHPTSSPKSVSRAGFTSSSTLGQTRRSCSPKTVSRCDVQSEAILEKEQDDPPDLVDSDIYLAVFASDLSRFSKRIGIAYLNAESEVIHLGEFIDPDGFILNSTKLRLAPKVIITQARPDQDFFKYLQGDCDQTDAVLYNVQTVRRSEFNFEGSLNRLKLIHIRELEDSKGSDSPELYIPGSSEFVQTMKLMSVVQFEKRNMICALGGLLSYIQKNNVISQLEDRNLPLSISSIRQIELANTVIVDDTTLRALSICQSESHPVGSTSGKEGLSVFKLLDETRTTQGRKLLKAWLLAPTTDLDVIHRRQDAISDLLDPRNGHWFAEISLRISTVKDIKRLLIKMENIRATYSDWILLTESIQQLISLRELANTDDTNFCLLNIIRDIWDDEIVELNNLITSVIDFTESSLSKRLEIRHGISPELDKMKYNYEQLGIFLTSVAQDLVASSSTDFQHLEVLQLPQLGHLIAIPVDTERPIEAQKSVPSFDFQFYAEGKFFFKNDRTRQLDQEIGDIRGVIFDVEASFIRELAEHVLACKSQLIILSSAIAEIDCLLSLAKAASIYNLARPDFIEGRHIEIRNGFHLVQGQTLDQFIPNDTVLGNTESSKPMMLVTGPNRSGKSILLKQVGIIVYLAHCGSEQFIPAESAILGPVDQIFCRIDLQESATSSLSTFATDCNQISRMVRHATPSSLLLLDEFGKGTCKEDGVALLTAVIHYFGNKDWSEIPRSIITTHFHEVFTLKLLPEQESGSPLSFYKMDVIAKMYKEADRTDLSLDQVTFLYKLIPGIAMNSYGLDCASMAGLPRSIIDRANQVAEAYINQQPIHRINEDGTGYEKLYLSFINLDLNNSEAVKEFIDLVMTI